MQRKIISEKKYYHFPRASSIVDYSPNYSDYYPHTDTTSDDSELDRKYPEESYNMKGDTL